MKTLKVFHSSASSAQGGELNLGCDHHCSSQRQFKRIYSLEMKCLILLLACTTLASATIVRPCDSGRTYSSSDVEITNCNEPPCKLKQKTKVGVTIQLKPDEDVPNLQNSVFAMVLGVPLPFIGVDGTDASSNVFNLDGSNAQFPLKAGQVYVYKNEFDILPVYPRIKVDVHWALTDGRLLFPKNIHCFNVQSKITA